MKTTLEDASAIARSTIGSTRRASESFWQMMFGTAFVGMVCHVAFVVLFYLSGVTTLALVNIGSVALYAMAAFLLGRRLSPATALFLIIFEANAHAVLASFWVGWDTGFYCYAMLTVPVLIVAEFKNLHYKIIAVAGSSIIVMGLDVLARGRTPYHALPDHVINGLHYFNLGASLLILIFLVATYFRLVKQAESKLHILATTDALTQLLNRRSMNSAWQAEQNRRKTSGDSLALILCDIDYFKRINDTYGHDTGDRVLQNVSETLAGNLRASDHLARWGGEEFMIMLVGETIDTAQQTAEKLRAAVAAIAMTPTTQQTQDAVSITATFGVTDIPFDASETLEAAFARADAALYEGKSSGRNCVCCAEH